MVRFSEQQKTLSYFVSLKEKISLFFVTELHM